MSLASRIEVLLDEPRLAELVTAYFDAAGPFAGHTFDLLDPNAPLEITAADLLAVSLLDVVYGPAAVRRILEDPNEWSELLAEIPADAVIWEMDETTYAAADRMWRAWSGSLGSAPQKRESCWRASDPRSCRSSTT